jgi:hypothetical protein
MDVKRLIADLRGLSADAIRHRLAELAAEEKVLRLLLRAALRAVANEKERGKTNAE